MTKLFPAVATALLLAGCAAGRGADRIQPLPRPGTVYQANGQKVQITSLTQLPPPNGAVAGTAPAVSPADGGVPPTFQFLYGSGEAAALSRQAYRGLAAGAIAAKAHPASVVLAPGATLAQPRFTDCGGKPPAAVFDADETLILNLGVEEDAARHPRPFDVDQWTRWERTGARAVAPVPGAVEALARLRQAGVTVIVNSNRSTTTAVGTVAALKAAGLGDFVLGTTLFLRDPGSSSGKDARRALIAARYCVVAMAGDQLGDFTDLFATVASSLARRTAADSGRIGELWGAGWFVLPNPVYGSGLNGGYDEVFPLDKRWVDPGAAATR